MIADSYQPEHHLKEGPMHFSRLRFLTLVLIACAVTIMTGCQTIRNSNAAAKEAMLSAAGFQMKQAQNQEQLTDVRELPQRRFVAHTLNGHVLYVFADVVNCQCIYVGTEKNYQQYQKMAFQQNITDEREMTAELNSETALNWGLWGGWGPWGY